MPAPVVILGLGFTGQRLARRLLERSQSVYAAVRDARRFEALAARGLQCCEFTPGALPKSAVVVHSIPPIAHAENAQLRELIGEIHPSRVIYISSTGVYGAQTEVSAATQAAPVDDTGRSRVAEESWLAAGPWSSLILRSSAIYGPGRGAHVRLREGKRPRGHGFVSRIHVEDLVALLEAGIEAALEGAWPVADNHPCATDEIVAWCAELMGIAVPSEQAATYPVAGRKVDGSEVRKLLGVELKYPSYKTGIPASLAEEN